MKSRHRFAPVPGHPAPVIHFMSIRRCLGLLVIALFICGPEPFGFERYALGQDKDSHQLELLCARLIYRAYDNKPPDTQDGDLEAIRTKIPNLLKSEFPKKADDTWKYASPEEKRSAVAAILLGLKGDPPGIDFKKLNRTKLLSYLMSKEGIAEDILSPFDLLPCCDLLEGEQMGKLSDWLADTAVTAANPPEASSAKSRMPFPIKEVKASACFSILAEARKKAKNPADLDRQAIDLLAVAWNPTIVSQQVNSIERDLSENPVPEDLKSTLLFAMWLDLRLPQTISIFAQPLLTKLSDRLEGIGRDVGRGDVKTRALLAGWMARFVPPSKTNPEMANLLKAVPIIDKNRQIDEQRLMIELGALGLPEDQVSRIAKAEFPPNVRTLLLAAEHDQTDVSNGDEGTLNEALRFLARNWGLILSMILAAVGAGYAFLTHRTARRLAANLAEVELSRDQKADQLQAKTDELAQAEASHAQALHDANLQIEQANTESEYASQLLESEKARHQDAIDALHSYYATQAAAAAVAHRKPEIAPARPPAAAAANGGEMARLTEQLTKLQNDLAAADSKASAANRDLTAAQTTVQAAQERERSARGECQRLQERQAALEGQLKEAKAEIAQSRDDARTVRNSELDLRKLVAARETEIQDIRAQAEALRGEKGTLGAEMRALSDRAEQAALKAAASIEDLRQTLTSEKARHETARTELDSARTQAATLDADLAAARRQTEATDARMEQWRKEQSVSQRLLYPPSFHEGGPLAKWREYVEQQIAAGDAEALLLRSYLQLYAATNGAARQANDSKTVEALWWASQHLYRLIEHGGYAPEQAAATALEWAGAIGQEVGEAIKIKVAQPGERTNPTWMDFANGSSVARVRSWAVQGRGAILRAEVEGV